MRDDEDRQFICTVCGTRFTMPQAVLAQYPRWAPSKCRACHGGGKPKPAPSLARRAPQAGLSPQGNVDAVEGTRAPVTPTLEAALERVVAELDAGPGDGVFTDGGCSGNPGPGGWGVVRVGGHRIVDRQRGEHPHTTNNRMELTALIAGYRMISPDEELTVWTDSELCVNTFNRWAAGWARLGWRRKGGPIKNLDLIQPLYDLVQARPHVTLRWIKAHDGSRWNEYVDLLATAHLRRS